MFQLHPMVVLLCLTPQVVERSQTGRKNVIQSLEGYVRVMTCSVDAECNFPTICLFEIKQIRRRFSRFSN